MLPWVIVNNIVEYTGIFYENIETLTERHRCWPGLPLIGTVGLAFPLCTGLAIILSIVEGRDQPCAVELADMDFSTSNQSNWAGIGVVVILTALYTTWW